MLFEQVGERFVRQFLKARHPVASKLLQLVEGVVVKGDQFAHVDPCFLGVGSIAAAGNRSGTEPATRAVVESPGLTLLFLGVVVGLGIAFVWMLWEIEQVSKPHRNGDRVG